MMKNIDQLLDELIVREGGYSNDPADSGGETMYGITKVVARAHGYHDEMRNMPKSVAKNIYQDQYWTLPRFDLVAQRLPSVAEELFDTGVNMGPMVAAKFLQRALSVLVEGPPLVVDGAIGRVTLYALDAFIKQRGKDKAAAVLLRLLNAQQAVRYMEIAEKNPSQEKFMFGWTLNRVE